MKKMLPIFFLVFLGASISWFYRSDLLLMVIKYRMHNAFEISETIEVPWTENFESQISSIEGERPNLILIVVDDLGYNDISLFGGGIIPTPAINRLASSGAIFNQSYAGANTCAPSRAMIMTGRYPTKNGFEFTPTPPGMNKALFRIWSDKKSGLPPPYFDEALDKLLPPFSEQGLPSSEYTVAELLRDSGYYNALIGKWHLGRFNGMSPNDQGFHDSLLMASGLYLPEDDPGVVNAKLPFDPIDRVLWASLTYANSFNSGNSDRFKPGGYLTDYWTEEAIKVIKNNKENPFFLYLAHWGPHTPLQATKEDYDAVGPIYPHRKRVYAAMIRAIDRSVENIMTALLEEGLDENTIIMFTSDNGGAGYIGLPEVNKPFRGWKRTMFEGGLRVPLFIRWPAEISKGTIVEEPVSHIDLFATIAEATKAEIPNNLNIDGVNLFPLLNRNDELVWPRENLFWQNGHYKAVRHDNFKMQVYDHPEEGKKIWLNNLSSDPTEQVNLAQTEPNIAKHLFELLEAHHSEASPPQYPSVIQGPVMIDKTLVDSYIEGDEYVYSPN